MGSVGTVFCTCLLETTTITFPINKDVAQSARARKPYGRFTLVLPHVDQSTPRFECGIPRGTQRGLPPETPTIVRH